jgi:hypothetical protein
VLRRCQQAAPNPNPKPNPTTTMNKHELIEQLRTPREAVAAVIAAAGNTDQCIDAVAEMVRAEMYRGEFGYASELVTALDEQLTP